MTIAKDEYGFNIDTADIINFSIWLGVLAAPHLFRSIGRTVDPVHLAGLLDVWIAYVDRGDRYQQAMFSPVPYEQRPELARRLRGLVAAWRPPELPTEITEAARALLHAEGLKSPQGAGWDELTFELEDERVEDILLWPEGVPRLLRQAKERGA